MMGNPIDDVGGSVMSSIMSPAVFGIIFLLLLGVCLLPEDWEGRLLRDGVDMLC